LKLTDLTVKNLCVPKGRRTFFDDAIKGFGIRVTPLSKTFVLVIHRGNRNEWETLGKYPIVSLGAAREAARNRLATIQLKQEHAVPDMTFADAFELFKETHTRKKNRQRTAKDTERLIEKHLLPKLRHREIDDIATHEVTQLVDKLLQTPGTCFHVFAAARLIFHWAARRRLIVRSPLDGVPEPVEIVPRERTLSDDELREVLSKAITDGSTFGKIVQLLIITGQRRAQIAALRGEYIQKDDDEKLIAWPTDAMKKRSHSIPLTPMAETLLADAPKQGYVFPARGRGDSPFNGFSKSKAAFDKTVSGVKPWTLHDLRRTFSTGLARLRVAPHVKEMLLSHASAKDPVEAIYDRYNYIGEQREALLKWQNHLQVLLLTAESAGGRGNVGDVRAA
jgi:integrase